MWQSLISRDVSILCTGNLTWNRSPHDLEPCEEVLLSLALQAELYDGFLCI